MRLWESVFHSDFLLLQKPLCVAETVLYITIFSYSSSFVYVQKGAWNLIKYNILNWFIVDYVSFEVNC